MLSQFFTWEMMRKSERMTRATAEFPKKTGPASKEGSKAEASESFKPPFVFPVSSFFPPIALHLYLHAMIQP